jgi:nitrate/TMAO reductase-like tetraheme cytochrome c subunit
MPTRSDGFPARLLMTALALVWLAVTAVTAAASRSPVASKTDTAAVTQTTGFAGDETCATCHDTEAKGLHATLHGKAQNTTTPAAQEGRSCETCHGPGQKHVESGNKADIKQFTALSARDANDACLSCHAKKSAHSTFEGSMHDARNRRRRS